MKIIYIFIAFLMKTHEMRNIKTHFFHKLCGSFQASPLKIFWIWIYSVEKYTSIWKLFYFKIKNDPFLLHFHFTYIRNNEIKNFCLAFQDRFHPLQIISNSCWKNQITRCNRISKFIISWTTYGWNLKYIR